MIDPFVLRALCAAIGVALIAGPLGAFVVWRRLVYLGEAIAQSALLGVVVGYMLDADPLPSMLGFSLALALGFTFLERQKLLPTDTILGVLAHGALAIGLILISLIDRLRVDLTSLLFGDLLAATDRDLLVILALAVMGGIVLLRLWRPLLSLTVQPDLARVEGIAATPNLLAFNLLLAGVIAVGMKLVGIVLVISLLIVPAAAARPWSRSPGMMAALASVIGASASALGVAGSFLWDVPTGPAIVATATAIFALSAGSYALTALRRPPAVVSRPASLGSRPQ